MLTPEMELEFVIAVLIATLLSLFVIVGVLTWAIIKVRKDPIPVMLLITLAVLTLVTVLTFALTRQNVLATLAGTGMGALAASLTNVFQNNKKSPPSDDPRKES